MIYIVGLGIEKGDVSLRGYELIGSGRTVLVKTARGATYAYFSGAEQTCDDLYETAENFDELHRAIADRVCALAERGDVVYCVPGSGATDASVAELAGRGADFELVPAADGAHYALAAHPCGAYAAIAATDAAGLVEVDPSYPLVVCEIENALLAGDVKLSLSRFYDDDAPMSVGGRILPLYELDRLPSYGHDTAICMLPRRLTEKKRFTFADLLRIMTVLTGPDGCPWDRAQTHDSICTNLVEEAYEAVDAIRARDVGNMLEEMGDVLLQAVFHCYIAEKAEEFDCYDVLSGLCEKLVFRHPHVFGTVHADDADSALGSWEAAKREEKSQTTLGASLDGIPTAFPQTLRALKIAKRAAKVGIGAAIDAETLADVVRTRLEALVAGEGDAERAVGECLYALSNLCRLLKLDPEIAAKRVNDAYVARCKAIERELAERGTSVYDATPEQLDAAIAAVVYREDR